jgi:hypothetical protein
MNQGTIFYLLLLTDDQQKERFSLMNWRDVIYQYLLACHEDSKRWCPPKSKEQFMDAHGTDALKQREQENQKRSDERLASQRVPLPETYEVIEESPTRVIAEIKKANDLTDDLHFIDHRFLVIKIDNQWKLEDVFWKCSLCKTGTCDFCDGKGFCTFCNGTGFTQHFFGLIKVKCAVCNGKPKCTLCSGTGRCSHCSTSTIPGWASRTSLLDEDKQLGHTGA